MSIAATPFGVTTTTAEVLAGIDLSGRAAIVTGAASGIGVETARALAGAGAEVTLAVRDLRAGQRVVREIAISTGNHSTRAATLELTDLASIDAFVVDWQKPLAILVNNAGVMMTPDLLHTSAGWELQFATNHMGHFALALGLHEALASAGNARIVSVASSGHGASPVVFDDLHFKRRPYDPMLAYGQSKTAQVLFAVEANRRWASDGVTANALMPGGIWTNLQRHWDPDVLSRLKATAQVKSVEQGAATSVFLAAHPSVEGIGGRYFEDCHEAEVVPEIVDGLHGVRDYALDPAVARRLWDASKELLDCARGSG